MIMAGNQQSSQVFIVTHDYEKMAEAIVENIHRGVTLIDSQGWYTKKQSKIVMVVCRKRETAMILKFVKTIDPDAFMTVGSVMGVYGKGFQASTNLMPLYADIVLPLAQPAYTFAVPEGMHVRRGGGSRAVRPRKFYTGVVWRCMTAVRRSDNQIHTARAVRRAPALGAAKGLWEWIAAYYMCSAGEVMRVALPSLMKPSGDTRRSSPKTSSAPVRSATWRWRGAARRRAPARGLREARTARAQAVRSAAGIASAGDETGFRRARWPAPTAGRLCRAACAGAQGDIVSTERERTVERADRRSAARTDRAAARSVRFAAGAVRRKPRRCCTALRGRARPKYTYT